MPIAGADVLGIFQMQQCPQLRISLKENVPSPAAITPIGTASGLEFCAMEVR
jgi:hypothetical protein